MTQRRAAVMVAALVAVGTAGCGSGYPPQPAPPSEALDRDFLGVVAPEILPAAPGARRRALAAQHRAGVRLLRQTFDWAQIETRPGELHLEPYDRLMADTARAGLDVLPIVFGTPQFESAPAAAGAPVTATTTFPPRSPRRFAEFAGTLARRYGPGGTFWRAHPRLPRRPIRAWQIWNEPNLPVYWGGRPDAAAYVALLRAAGTAIHSADRGAEIVTAGMPESRLGVPLATFLRQLYAAGARGSFETLAVQPYATSAAGVLAGARAAREIADEAGDQGAGLWITEVGWAAGGPGSSFTVSPARQAQLVSRVLREAGRQAAELRLRGLVYYSWRDVPVYPGGQDFWGLHTGLRTLADEPKPALAAFARAAAALNRAR